MQKLLGKLGHHGHGGDHEQHGSMQQQPAGSGPHQQPPSVSGGDHSHPPPDDPVPTWPQPGRTPPGPGQLPPKVASVQYHDKMRFLHPRGHEHTVYRDLGFTGVLSHKIIWTFGDTLMGLPGGGSMICAVDSTAIGSMRTPMVARDTSLWPGSDNVKSLLLPTPEEEADGGLSVYSYGGTNILETAPGHGIIYYLAMHRPGGVERALGAGVATVTLSQPGDVPVTVRNGQRMWNDFEPCWGDVGAVYDARSGYVYAYGHGPKTDKELGVRTFLCRAPAGQALDVAAYEYWLDDAREWTRQRLTLSGAMGSRKLENSQAIFGWMAMNQANPFWSNHFNCWMLLHSTGWPGGDVQIQTADALEGPWKEGGSVASTAPRHGEKDGMRYCATGHPEFDPSGRTVLATWTKNNEIYGATITWE